MGLNKIAVVGAGILASQSLLAADVATWASKAKEANLNVEYRFDHTYDDHKGENVNIKDSATGLESKKEGDPTSEFSVAVARLKLKGKINDNASYYFRLNLLKSGEEAIQYANVNWKLTDMFSLIVGKDKAVQGGGWEYYHQSYDMLIKGDYFANNLPNSAEYSNAASIDMNFGDAGSVRYQLANDYGTVWNKKRQPAQGLEYRGKFAGVEPIVQYTSYDMNHSNVITVGVKQETEAYKWLADYVMESRAKLAAGKELKDKLSSATVSFNMFMGSTEPFVKFSMFDNKQDGTDLKGNTYTYDATTGKVTPKWTDNGTHWVVGSFFMKDGEMFKPYLAYSAHSGKVFDPANDATSAKTATVTNSKVQLGVAGAF